MKTAILALALAALAVTGFTGCNEKTRVVVPSAGGVKTVYSCEPVEIIAPPGTAVEPTPATK